MGFIKRQFLKVIEWQDSSKDTIVYKFPMEGRSIIMNKSSLTVRESQVAIFVNEGQIADIFTPGRYDLTTENLPVLTELKSWKYMFNSPFLSDVYFVNTKQFINQKWGTTNPITVRDKDYGVIRLRGFGTFAYKVGDPKVFLKELFGTNSTFKTSDVTDYLKSKLVSCISDVIAESKIPAIDLASNLQEFNASAKGNLAEQFKELGIELTGFTIENISFPEEVEKNIDTRTSMGVMGDKMDTYVKFQSAQALRDAAKNEGGMSNLGVGLGTGVALGEVMKQAFKSQPTEQPAPAQQVNNVNTKFCSNCGAKIPANAKFCSECGQKQSQENVCPKCNSKVTPDSKFCPECGEKLK